MYYIIYIMTDISKGCFSVTRFSYARVRTHEKVKIFLKLTQLQIASTNTN